MTSPEWLAADEDDSDRFPQASDVSTTSTFKHSCGSTVNVVDAKEQPHECPNVPSPDPARVARWEFLNTASYWPRQKAEAAMRLADEERASLVEEVERLTIEKTTYLSELHGARDNARLLVESLERVCAERDAFRDERNAAEAKVAKVEALADEHDHCSGCPSPWWLRAVLADAPAGQRAEGGA